MKHNLLIVAGIALLLTTTGCKKEENVKHLTKIYSTMTTTMNGNVISQTDRGIQEEWTWDGDNLTTIKHYNPDGQLRSVSTLSYTDGLLTKVEDVMEETKETYRLDIKYDAKDKVISTNEYKDDVLYLTYKYEYNGSDKISKYTKIHTVNGSSDTSIYDVEWTGNNITRTNCPSKDSCSYTYDNNPNPFIGIIESDRAYSWASKNNVTSVDGTPHKITYDNDGWPIKIETVTTSGAFSIASTLEYEYDR